MKMQPGKLMEQRQQRFSEPLLEKGLTSGFPFFRSAALVLPVQVFPSSHF